MGKVVNVKKKRKEKGNIKMPATIKEEVKFQEFIAKNREFVYAIANENVTRGKDGRVVLAKDDPWRNEHEWDEMYQRLKNKK